MQETLLQFASVPFGFDPMHPNHIPGHCIGHTSARRSSEEEILQARNRLSLR